MAVHPFYLTCLAHASYLVTDARSKTAAVIDPQRDTDVYFELAAKLGVEIKHVLLTHFHADFVAGHLEIRERTGATARVPTGSVDADDFGPVVGEHHRGDRASRPPRQIQHAEIPQRPAPAGLLGHTHHALLGSEL